MGFGSLGGRRFRLDPTSISFSFSIKTSVTETVGGKVVQVFGTSISDLVVAGSFGVGGWREQADFLEQTKRWADTQISNPGATPMRFAYPPRGWDFLVYLKDFTQTGSGDSVEASNLVPSPGWTLTLYVVEDNGGLRSVKDTATLAYIERLSQGIGWQQTKFNGPGGPDEVAALIQANGGTFQSTLAAADEGTLVDPQRSDFGATTKAGRAS